MVKLLLKLLLLVGVFRDFGLFLSIWLNFCFGVKGLFVLLLVLGLVNKFFILYFKCSFLLI